MSPSPMEAHFSGRLRASQQYLNMLVAPRFLPFFGYWDLETFWATCSGFILEDFASCSGLLCSRFSLF